MALVQQRKPLVNPVSVEVDFPTIPTLELPGSLSDTADKFNDEMSQWYESHKQATLDKLDELQGQITALKTDNALLRKSLNITT